MLHSRGGKMSKNDLYSGDSDCEILDDNFRTEGSGASNVETLSQATTAKSQPVKEKSTTRAKRTSKSKEEAEYEKTKKKLLQIESRNKKPGECLKHIMVMLDNNLASTSFFPKITKALQEANIKCEQNSQLIPNMISFWRSVTTITEGSDMKITTKSEDVLQDQILIYVPREEFVSLVYQQNHSNGESIQDQLDLDGFVEKCSELLGPNIKLTFFVLKLDDYLRTLASKKTKNSKMVMVDSKMIEQATFSLQMTRRCHFKYVNSDDELATTILGYTKSIAECPYKREMRAQCHVGSLYVSSSKGCAKLGPEETWRSQLNTFKNVTADVSNAIAREYPTPKSLFEKYLSCPDQDSAIHLLDDIVVRRGAGIMATSRRVGPELSRRVHTLMTSRDGSILIT